VEILFVNINQKLVLRGQPETIRLWELIRDQVELTTSLHDEHRDDDLKEDDPFIFYRSAGYGGLRLYLKCETPAHGRRFHELDPRRSLRSNLRGKTIVEHPVLHVVMKADECVYRAPADCFDPARDLPAERKIKEEDETEGRSLGEVWEQEAQMEADPEAFRHYFDFYLNYYTQKFARQTGGAPLVPPIQQNDGGRAGELRSRGASSAAISPPNFSIPPPEFEQTLLQPPELSPFAATAAGANKPKHWPHPPPVNRASLNGREHGNQDQLPASSHPRARLSSVPKRNTALEQALAVKNKLNEARAQKIREELRKSALVAYEDSDSE